MADTRNLPNFNERTLSDFKSKLVGGGARPNLFECEISFPAGLSGVTVDEDYSFMIKAASLPASNINVIDIPFRGRNLKIAGDRTFDPWTITVINDTNFKIRNAFEKWMNYMNRHDDNAGVITPAAYQVNMMVHQMGRGLAGQASDSGAAPTTGSQIPILKSYRFYGVFPTSISAIELSYDSADSIEEFTVDLQVQWYDALDATGASILEGLGTEQ
jgi:hypothetical protein